MQPITITDTREAMADKVDVRLTEARKALEATDVTPAACKSNVVVTFATADQVPYVHGTLVTALAVTLERLSRNGLALMDVEEWKCTPMATEPGAPVTAGAYYALTVCLSRDYQHCTGQQSHTRQALDYALEKVAELKAADPKDNVVPMSQRTGSFSD